MTYPYSYVVVQHVPDPGAGEVLNIGVVVFSGAAHFISLKADHHYERLSQAFARFDGAGFRRAMANLLLVFRAAERDCRERPLFDSDRSFADWLASLVPDVGASLSFTAPRHGISANLDEEVAILFERMVTSQKAAADEQRRSDDDRVWRRCAPRLSPTVSREIKPASFVTPSVKVEFEHAVKNGRWHVIQPLSMDFKRPESMQRKASQWVGTAVGLSQAPDFGTILFVMGRPSAGHAKAFSRAKALLAQTPAQHDIIDEQDTGRLNQRLLDLLGHRDE